MSGNQADAITTEITDWDSFRQARSQSASRHLPVLEAEPGELKPGGPLAAWDRFTKALLPAAGWQVVLEGWGGLADLSAEACFAYDRDYFYWAASIRDNIHFAVEGSDLWRGDSIQLAFSDGGVYGPDLGISCVSGEAKLWQWKEGRGTLGPEAVEGYACRSGEETRYELKIPWKCLSAHGLVHPDMTFAMLVNDNDGGSRRGWVEWTPGFGREKDPGRHGLLHLLPAAEKWTVWVEGPAELEAGLLGTYTVYLPNLRVAARTFRLSSPGLGIGSTDLTVPAMSVLAVQAEVSFAAPGSYILDFAVTDSEGRMKRAEAAVTVPYQAEALSAMLDEAESGLSALDGLLALARDRGIPGDYERIHAEVIRDFVGYGREDIRQGQLQRAHYVVRQLERLCGEACRSLEETLAGRRRVKEVPRYATGRPALSGLAFYGGTEVRGSGLKRVRPVFFNGYGHFGQVRRDLPRFQDLGANIVQIEIGPESAILPGVGEERFRISAQEIETDIVRVLREAEQHHVAVNLLLSPHYFPAWALEKWPELAAECSHSLHYLIDHPIAVEIVEAFLRTIIPLIRGFGSLHSVTLTNEPVYQTHKDRRYLPAWHTYLERLYGGDLEQLNRVYGSGYSGFGEIPMPNGVQATPQAYDWVMFNQGLFRDWHQFMADIIRELAPELPIHAKIMGDHVGALGWGIDIEAFSRLSDVNGNDNWNYLGEGVKGYLKETGFYDLQASLKRAPVFNSEHHIIPDGDQRYVAEHAVHVRNMLWLGALHGKSASTIWVWERTYDETSDTAGSILHRPDVVAAVGRTNHDLNRLAWEVAAFQEADTPVAILYSVPSTLYSKEYNAAFFDVYGAVSFCGIKAGFVSERQVAEGEADRFAFLIVPFATHVQRRTLEGLNAYARQGGRLLLAGRDNCSRDEHGLPLPQEELAELAGHALSLASRPETAETLRDRLLPVLEQAGRLTCLTAMDLETGKPVLDVEWRTVLFRGRCLVSMVNLTTSPKRVRLERNGCPVAPVAELIEDAVPASAELQLAGLSPYLFDLGPGVGADPDKRMDRA